MWFALNFYNLHHTIQDEDGEYPDDSGYDDYPEDIISEYPKCEVPKRVNSYYEGNFFLFSIILPWSYCF